MLQDFRDNLRGVTATILVGIIIIPFAFWGVESLFVQGSSVEEAAEVNGETVTELEVMRGIEMQKQKLLAQFSDIDPLMLDDERLRPAVIDQLVRQKLLLQVAREGGLGVSDKTFNEIIVNSEAFKEGDRFSREIYEYQIGRLGYTPRTYQQSVKEDLMVSQLTAGIQASGIVTPVQVANFNRLALQSRDYSYVQLPVPDAENVEVSEAEVASYYEANPERFTEPDKVVVEYIRLNADVLAPLVEVDPEQVEARLASESASGSSEVSWHLAHIQLGAGENAESLIGEIQARLAAGEEFEALARDYSQDFGSADVGGDLGTFTEDILPEGFADAISELEVGAVSQPVVLGDSTHLIKVVDKIEAESNPALEREQVVDMIRQELVADKLPGYLDRLKDETYSVDSLAAAADVLGLPAAETQPFAETGGEGIARFPAVIKAAFSEDILKHGYSSEVIEIADNDFVVVKLKEFIPTHVADLDVVRSDIEQTLVQRKLQARLTAQAEGMVAQLRRGEQLAEVAAEESLEVDAVEAATRFDRQQPPELVSAVFQYPTTVSLPASDVVTAGNGQVYVVSLTSIEAGTDDKLSDQERASIKRSLAQVNGAREYLAYLDSLKEGGEITVR